MRNLLLTCLLLCLVSSDLLAQYPTTIDSLKVFLKNKPQDTTYVLALNEYIFLKIQQGEYAVADSGIKVIDALAKKLDYGIGFYKAMNLRGVVEYSKQKPEAAMEYFKKCNTIIEKYQLPKSIYQNSLNNISIIYNDLGDRENATKYAMQLIDFQENHKIKPFKSRPYDQIGDNLIQLGKYQKALEYFEKALAIEIENKNDVNIAIAQNHIGNVYEYLEKPQQSIKHFLIGLKKAEEANYKLLQTDFLTNLGRLYYSEGEVAKAEQYLKKSEKFCRELEANNSLKIACQNLADIYFEQKKYNLAEKYYLEALELAKQAKDISMLYSVNENLSLFYAETKNFEKAFQHKQAASVAKDSSFKIETTKKAQDLLAKYETKQKEQEIALLNEKNAKASFQNRSIIIGAILLVLLISIFTIFVLNRNKLKRLQEAEKLRNRIASDIHDEIGSTLSSILLISGMAKNQTASSSIEKSNKMFTKIHSDSQHVMESVDEIIWSVNPVNDSLQGILVRLREYTLPLAESKNIVFDFKVDEGIEHLALPMEIRRNLYLIIKEAINNLVKYSEASQASIHISKDKKDIAVTVKDNGRGFDTLLNTTRNGLRNMKLRAKEIGAKIDILSSPHKGSSVILSFHIT